MTSCGPLQDKWKQLYSEILPARAKAHDSAQKRWPVTLDHCFARIILDKVVGEGSEPWTKRLRSPAVKHMTENQLLSCIELAEKIKNGKADLVELDKNSLRARNTGHQKYRNEPRGDEDTKDGAQDSAAVAGSKRKANESDIKTASGQRKTPKMQQTTLSVTQKHPKPSMSNKCSSPVPDHSTLLKKIDSHQTLTPYRKRLYSTLLLVPRGRYTTYAAMSDYLKSSARAVGNGMRNNPFAPEVPCHRVLAADRSIGGFGGSWGKDGKHSNKKLKLLAEEGVKFNSSGKAIGDPFRDFGGIS